MEVLLHLAPRVTRVIGSPFLVRLAVKQDLVIVALANVLKTKTEDPVV